MIYFCFKCRRRVQKDDPQHQCVNQKCQYYGKLLCNSCTTEEPRITLAPVYTVTPGWFGDVFTWSFVWASVAFMIVASLFAVHGNPIVAGGIAAIVTGAGFFALLGNEHSSLGEPCFNTRREWPVVEPPRHRCCIACQSRVENL
jgi:hypothetical protein